MNIWMDRSSFQQKNMFILVKKAPVTLGHEFSGEIVEVGVMSLVSSWGSCNYRTNFAKHNLIGDYNLDPNLNFVGLAADGGFAKYCVLDGDLVHVIPDSLSYEQAALQNLLL